MIDLDAYFRNVNAKREHIMHSMLKKFGHFDVVINDSKHRKDVILA